MHYCGEDFKRINLYAEQKTCCPEAETPMPCCEDISHVEQPNRLHVVPSSETFTCEVAVCPPHFLLVPFLFSGVVGEFFSGEDASPISPGEAAEKEPNRPRLHVQYGVFLI